jgi:HlyD family secretion protein
VTASTRTSPRLADRRITVEVKLIATKGRICQLAGHPRHRRVRPAHIHDPGLPHGKVPELRPGMSAYLDWRKRD